MASLVEVIAQIKQGLDTADQLVAALTASAEHATEAVDLLRDVGTGSAHEPEYVQAAASLTSVVEGVDHLLGVLQALTARFSRYLVFRGRNE